MSKKLKEITLSNAFGKLQVGQKVLFCGDGKFRVSDQLSSGTIAEMCDNGNAGKHVYITRDDGVVGRGTGGSWVIQCAPNKDVVTVIPLTEAFSANGTDLAMGDVITHSNGPYEYTAMVAAVTSNDIRYETISDVVKEKGAIDIGAPVTRHGSITPKCTAAEGCKSPASAYVDGIFYCKQHVASFGRIVQCGACGTSVFENYAMTVNRSLRCSQCYAEGPRPENAIKGHSYKPTPKFAELAEEKPLVKSAIYLGVEAEVEVPGRTTRDEDASTGPVRVPSLDRQSAKKMEFAATVQEKFATKSNGWFYIKHDGSLTNGIEIVSHPATLKAHKNKYPWKEMLDYLKDHGCLADTTSTCGLHVHVNKSVMSEDAQIRLGYFINSHITKMEAIARRGSCEYAKFVDVDGSERLNKNTSDRYRALNWQNKHTVEFRLFRGTIEYATLISTLEFVVAAVNYAKATTIEELKRPRLSWTNFVSFVSEGDYPNLAQYLNERGAN